MAKEKRGGVNAWPYHDYETVEKIDGIKVIRQIAGGNASLPRFSNSKNAVYILKDKKTGKYKSIGIYGEDRRIKKEIEFTHGHKIRNKDGSVKEVLVRGVAHIHFSNGGRENNVRYLNKKEIKRYGDIVVRIGGKVNV